MKFKFIDKSAQGGMVGIGRNGESMVWDWIAERASDLEIRQRVTEAMTWFAVPELPTSKERSELNNLALGHAWAIKLNLDGGRFAEITALLLEAAGAADHLGAILKRIGDGELAVMMRCQDPAQVALQHAADFNDLIPQLVPIPVEVKPIFPGTPVEEIPPPWLTRTEALAACFRDGARFATELAIGGGRRRAWAEFYGSSELQLLVACAGSLKKLGKDDAKAYQLARIVHHLVAGKPALKGWATEAKRQFDPWWGMVRAWYGNDADAPPEIQKLLRQGPHAMPKRRTRNPS